MNETWNKDYPLPPHPDVPGRRPWTSPASPLMRTPLDALLIGLGIGAVFVLLGILYIGLGAEFMDFFRGLAS
jgi:hypothetical protein